MLCGKVGIGMLCGRVGGRYVGRVGMLCGGDPGGTFVGWGVQV